MRKRMIRTLAFVAAAMATGASTPAARAAADAQLVAGFCYEFPGGITVCCDGGGCDIK